MIFIQASISITGHRIIMINQNTKEWERWNPIPIFPIEAMTICLVFLLIIVIITLLKPTFIILFLYLANILLEYSTVLCGFDICP